MVGPQGQLVMLDRYNHLWEATQDPATKAWVLSAEPRARLGPGRPLGYHFDHQGNLIMCDSLKVLPCWACRGLNQGCKVKEIDSSLHLAGLCSVWGALLWWLTLALESSALLQQTWQQPSWSIQDHPFYAAC